MAKLDESDGYAGLMPTEKEVTSMFEKYGTIQEYSPLNALRDAIHENAKNKGFYDINEEQPIINIPERLMLIVSELGEALEAFRHNHYAHNEDYFYSKCIIEGLFNKYGFEEYIKDSFEDELADSIIRILDLCGHLNIDIQKHIELKMEYNKTRPYKHGKKC